MNRAKKEEIRKYNEAREGKSDQEIVEGDRKDSLDAKIKHLASLLHGRLFPEEYDFMGDSILDAKERDQGNNPMSEDYIRKIDDKRRVLGFSALDSSGNTIENDTLKFCTSVARNTLES